MNYIRRGTGKPLLLIHGLGGSWRSWTPILDGLAAEREVIAVDLPGSGQSPPLPGESSIRTFADAITCFVVANGLEGVDAVGSSMGARLVLELARRGGVLGGGVSLNPGGFWRGWERHAFFVSIYLSVRLVRGLRAALPSITRSAVGRTLLLSQFSARPWALTSQVTLEELRGYADSPSFDELLYNLAYGEIQQGAAAGAIPHPLVIGWGDRDRVCFPWQAKRALEAFPDARLRWFRGCGHFPQWDAPDEATRLILDVTGGREFAALPVHSAGQSVAFHPSPA